MLYLLDASMLITANKSYYPVDSVPEFWEWLLYMAEQGSVKIPLEIFEEIKDGPDNEEKDLLFGWVQKFDVKNALLLVENVNVALKSRKSRVRSSIDTFRSTRRRVWRFLEITFGGEDGLSLDSANAWLVRGGYG